MGKQPKVRGEKGRLGGDRPFRPQEAPSQSHVLATRVLAVCLMPWCLLILFFSGFSPFLYICLFLSFFLSFLFSLLSTSCTSFLLTSYTYPDPAPLPCFFERKVNGLVEPSVSCSFCSCFYVSFWVPRPQGHIFLVRRNPCATRRLILVMMRSKGSEVGWEKTVP
jgi:hypothetical protein